MALSWQNSLILRVGILGSLIMVTGYSISAWVGIQTTKATARLVLNSDIENALDQYQQLLKDNYHLRQRIVVGKLKNLHAKLAGPFDQNVLKAWLKDLSTDLLTELADAKVRPANPKLNEDTSGPPTWLTPDLLLFQGYAVELPKGQTRAAFSRASAVLQRYHLLSVEFDQQILPSLQQTQGLILVLCFLVLMAITGLLARQVKHHLNLVVEAFQEWTKGNFNFRLSTHFQGELRLIADQFNAMATAVAQNRERALSLEKIASWQDIARKLAHEIKNPLTPIQMVSAQLAKNYTGDDPKFRTQLDEARQIIQEEVQSLRRMVNEFSDFARLPTPRFAATDLVPLLQNVVAMHRAAYPQHEFLLYTEQPQSITEVDADLLRQVILNLSKNAVEASPGQGGRISISLRSEDQFVLISVSDNGSGIAPQDQQAIFGAYFTTKHTGPSPGMGLGLTVCQKIVLDHAGEILVSSQPGQTTFTVKLPRFAEEGVTRD